MPNPPEVPSSVLNAIEAAVDSARCAGWGLKMFIEESREIWKAQLRDEIQRVDQLEIKL
jgi:hypothetical protein